jgi:hypothetical protein
VAKYRFDLPGIEAYIGETKQRGLKVVRRSTVELMSRVIDDAPVRTGFMVASAKVRMNPRGSLKERKRPPGYWEPEPRELKMAEVREMASAMKLKDTLALSFVANYTTIVHEGLSSSPAQPFVTINLSAWPSIVRKYVMEAKAG